jgi:hypothetical protein
MNNVSLCVWATPANQAQSSCPSAPSAETPRDGCGSGRGRMSRRELLFPRERRFQLGLTVIPMTRSAPHFLVGEVNKFLCDFEILIRSHYDFEVSCPEMADAENFFETV